MDALFWLYKRRRLVLYVLLAMLLAAAGWWAWGKLHPSKPVTEMSQQQAETQQGVLGAAHDCGVHISHGQAVEAAQAIREVATGPPDEVVPTTGAGMPQALQQSQQQSGADIQIVTDPAKPDQKPEQPKPDQPVHLNVYNVKAFPKHLLEATVYPSLTGGLEAADVAYMSRVKVFGFTGYLGPVLNYDADRKAKLRVGARLTVPID